MSGHKQKPHWIDCLREKHECWSYDDPGVIEASHAGRAVRVLVPSYLTRVRVLVTAESGPFLFLLGQEPRKEADGDAGVVMVARHREGETYEVGVWHELYPWALKHFGLAPSE